MMQVQVSGNLADAPRFTPADPGRGTKAYFAATVITNTGKDNQTAVPFQVKFWDRAAEALSNLDWKKGTRIEFSGRLMAPELYATKSGEQRYLQIVAGESLNVGTLADLLGVARTQTQSHQASVGASQTSEHTAGESYTFDPAGFEQQIQQAQATQIALNQQQSMAAGRQF